MIKIQEILEMSIAERILMIEQIRDSIDTASIPITSPQEQELDRRLSRYERGENAFFSWDDIKADLNSTI